MVKTDRWFSRFRVARALKRSDSFPRRSFTVALALATRLQPLIDAKLQSEEIAELLKVAIDASAEYQALTAPSLELGGPKLIVTRVYTARLSIDGVEKDLRYVILLTIQFGNLRIEVEHGHLLRLSADELKLEAVLSVEDIEAAKHHTTIARYDHVFHPEGIGAANDAKAADKPVQPS